MLDADGHDLVHDTGGVDPAKEFIDGGGAGTLVTYFEKLTLFLLMVQDARVC